MSDHTPMHPDDARRVLLLALADDELVTGHRHSHWTGVAPSLEEDLAFSTIAQDEINHADVWYQLLVSSGESVPEDLRSEVDALGLGREPHEYRHAVLCERPPTDFAFSLARHLLYDHADAVRLDTLVDSSDDDIAAVATKLQHEERYHLEHADRWLALVAAADDEAHAELTRGLEAAFPDALWLFEPLPGEDVLVAERILPAFSVTLLERWAGIVVPLLDAHGFGHTVPELLRGDAVAVPPALFADPGGRHGVHTPDFTDDVWPEMTHLHRAFPGARW